MHQDIKNFSNVTAIDTARKLKINLKLTRHGRTVSRVNLNGFEIYVDEVNFEFDLFDPIQLKINLQEFDEGTSGIEVGLTVNGLEVLPKYQHLARCPTNYIDKLGVWKMDIPANFYIWYHAISGQGFIA